MHLHGGFVCTLLACWAVAVHSENTAIALSPSVRLDCTTEVASDYFCCSSDETISRSAVCDHKVDCTNGKDEDTTLCGCPVGEFNCGDQCVREDVRCDGTSDCTNGRDEQDCEVYSCLPGQFKCTNNLCISDLLTCNHDDDCGDNSDEQDCRFRECWFGEFQCRNGSCVRPLNVCDGVNDCKDGHDEEDCDQGDFVTCEQGSQIHRFEWCDGKTDCKGNQMDETVCGNCKESEYPCSNGRCLSQVLVCNGQCDCAFDCSDEAIGCDRIYQVVNGVKLALLGRSIGCIEPFRTPEKELIIGADFICDGNEDCMAVGFVPDEFNCPGRGLKSLVYGEFETWHDNSTLYFHCSGVGDGRWLPITTRCNHRRDCLHGEDEDNCSFPSCNDDQYRCKNSQCIDSDKRCDAVFDCFDKSDELNCEAFSCDSRRRKCQSHQCVNTEYWCDRSKDCPDGSDEDNCEYRSSACAEDEFQCADGQCIPASQVCLITGNAKDGCLDGSHLIHCQNKTCATGWFKCTEGPCLNQSMVCDDQIDCPGSWNDEDFCPTQCSFKETRCKCWDIYASCQHLELGVIPSDIDPGVSYFNFSSNLIGRNLHKNSLISLRRANSLDLSNNSITSVPEGLFRNLVKLKILRLNDNNITVMCTHTFKGLLNLRMLYLQGNRIQTIERLAFQDLGSLLTLDLTNQGLQFLNAESFVGLVRLLSLDLSKNQLGYIPGNVFKGLANLQRLDVSSNRVITVDPRAFQDLSIIKKLITDEFRICCVAMHAGISTCSPSADEFSSCEDLMSHMVLRSFLWILGIGAVTGNLGVILWRCLLQHGKRGHVILAINLAIGDFLMGVYLVLIAGVDVSYRGVYALYEQYWRVSWLCQFAGFISTFSSEFTVLILTTITLERFLSVTFPFGNLKMSVNCIRRIVLLCWIIAFFIAVVPFLDHDYFGNFYGRSSVCLALHITTEKPKGWEYSVLVFIVLNCTSMCVIAFCYSWMFVSSRFTRKAVRRSSLTQREDRRTARKMLVIVATDAACWCPIILLGFLSLADFYVSKNVYAWVAVFVLPLNAALNPILYTFSIPVFQRDIMNYMRRVPRSLQRTLTLKLGSSRLVPTPVPVVEVSFFGEPNRSEAGRRTSSGRETEPLPAGTDPGDSLPNTEAVMLCFELKDNVNFLSQALSPRSHYPVAVKRYNSCPGFL